MLDTEMELARQIKAGKLELICPEMELLVCPGYEESALRGMGTLRSDSLGRLYFHIVSAFRGSLHPVLLGSKQPGDVFRPEDHVMLRAVDDTGREWRSNWLYIDLSRHLPLPNYSFQKRISTILHSGERAARDNSYVRMVIPNAPQVHFDHPSETRKSRGGKEVERSFSFDHHAHRFGAADVVFRNEEDGFLSASACTQGVFSPTWPGFLCHGLAMATGDTILPAVLLRAFDKSEYLELRSGPFLRHSSILPRPVYCKGSDSAADFWRLVELFVHYIERWPASDQALLLDELDGIRRGAQGSFQTACLTLSVGMESLVKLLLKDEPVMSKSNEDVQSLFKHLDQWKGDGVIKERARGALSRLAEISAADLMYAWAQRTQTSKTLVDRWKRLRHPKAHGNVVDESEGWSLYCSVAELMYRIVAFAIGYDGRITKSSERGWGLEEMQSG